MLRVERRRGIPVVKSAGAEEKLASFINKFDTKHRSLIRSVRKELRKRLREWSAMMRYGRR